MQGSLFQTKNKPVKKHESLPEKQGGKCANKVLLRSKKDPRQRRWQCTSSQMELFKDAHANVMMNELAKINTTHITRQRAEYPSIRKLQDEGLMKLEPNPSHFNYEFKVSLTRDGRQWLTERGAGEDRELAKKQTGMFKGMMISVQRMLKARRFSEHELTLIGMEAIRQDEANYRPTNNATRCSSCIYSDMSHCSLYNFRWHAEHTCDSWAPEEPGHVAPSPGQGHKGRAVTSVLTDVRPRRGMTLVMRRMVEKISMAKGAPHPIVSADIVTLAPKSGSWVVGSGYQCDYRQGVAGVGVLTIMGPRMVMPFNVVVKDYAHAKQRAVSVMKQLEQGVVPSFGIYQRAKAKRSKYGVHQGGEEVS